MSADDRDVAWEDWPPTLEDPDAERFKWAWNEAQGELVWTVSGPGEGRPLHEEQVRQAWGRALSSASGDVFGMATYEPREGRERALISVRVYYGAFVPASVARWFRDAFPDAELREQFDS